MTPTLVAIGIWIVALGAIGLLRGTLHQHPAVKALFFPGLALEAAVRLIACLMSGTPVKGIAPWQRGQGLIEVGASPIAHIGAPLYVGIRLVLTYVGMLVALSFFPTTVERSIALDHDYSLLENLRLAGRQCIENLIRLPQQIQVDRWHGSILLYLTSSYLLALGFSAREFIAAAWALTGMTVALLVAEWIGFRFGFLSRGQWIDFFYGEDLWSALSLLVELSCVTLSTLLLARLLFASSSLLRAQPARKNR